MNILETDNLAQSKVTEPTQINTIMIKLTIYFLGEENGNKEGIPIESADTSIYGYLKAFLREYRNTPGWKNKPILLTFGEPNKNFTYENYPHLKRKHESSSRFMFRILDMFARQVNEEENIVGGFDTSYIHKISEGNVQVSVGLVFYQPPIHTFDSKGTSGGFPKPEKDFFSVVGKSHQL